jgi:hypothetical protein
MRHPERLKLVKVGDTLKITVRAGRGRVDQAAQPAAR